MKINWDGLKSTLWTFALGVVLGVAVYFARRYAAGLDDAQAAATKPFALPATGPTAAEAIRAMGGEPAEVLDYEGETR
jgi:hypothetical protein